MNAKKVYRLYRELGLQLRNKTPKRLVKAKLRILTVVGTYSRLSPVVDPRFSYRGEDVVATLDRACRKIGYPKTIRVDNGSGSAVMGSRHRTGPDIR